MTCVINDGDQGVTLSDLQNTADSIKAIFDEIAHQLGVDPDAIKKSPIVSHAINVVDIAIADGAAETVDTLAGIAISTWAGVFAALSIPTYPFIAAVATAGFAGALYDASGNLRECAANDMKDLADTMSSNPDLNYPSLPAWMDGLENMFNDATDTPDPILTLRNIGMRGGDPLILDLNGDGVELVQLENSTARFDVNGDDFATPTGWVNAEDGLLVLSSNYLEMPFSKAA